MIVILTAIEPEYAAVREHLAEPVLDTHPAGTAFEVGAIAGHPGRRAAIALIGPGNTVAAALTERAIARYRPSLVVFVGVAGGLNKKLGIGDVVVATKVYAYHGGKDEAGGFRARPRAYEMPHAIEQIAGHVARRGKWGSGEVAVHFGAVAAGEVVVNSVDSALRKQIHDHYNDTIAVEMESAGLAHACHLNHATPMITVRGVSDLADGTKNHDEDQRRQPVAARNAAAFAFAVAAMVDDPAASSRETTQPTAVNLASGNAKVGQQIGTIQGSAYFGTAPEGGAR